jgi:hypothetical protein
MVNKKNISDELVRISLLMNYSLDKTLTENVKVLKQNKKVIKEQVPVVGNQGSSTKDIEDPEITNYKNSCLYPNKVVDPKKMVDSHGFSGMDAVKAVNHEANLVKDKKDESGNPVKYNWCAYPFQKKWIWVPSTAKIAWVSEESIINFAKKIGSGFENWLTTNGYKGECTKFDTNQVANELLKRMNIGDVNQINVGELKYTQSAYWDMNEGEHPCSPTNKMHVIKVYNGLYDDNGKVYSGPNWVDPRSDYEKFIDEWSFWVEIGVAIASFFAGLITGGATWVVYLEVFLEAVIGTASSIRQFQTGDNIGGSVSALFAILPFIKLPISFRGISKDDMVSLSKKWSDSGLKYNSSPEEYMKFVNEELTDSERKLMSLVFKNSDELVEGKFKSELLKALKDQLDYEWAIKNIGDVVADNPDLLKKIPIWKRIPAIELTSQLSTMLIGTVFEITMGQKLNDEQKMALSRLHSVVPDELKSQWFVTIVENVENIDTIIKTQDKKFEIISDFVGKDVEILNTYIKDSIASSSKEVGGESNSELNDVPKIHEIKLSETELIKLKENGWKTFDDTYKYGMKWKSVINTGLPKPNNQLLIGTELNIEEINKIIKTDTLNKK